MPRPGGIRRPASLGRNRRAGNGAHAARRRDGDAVGNRQGGGDGSAVGRRARGRGAARRRRGAERACTYVAAPDRTAFHNTAGNDGLGTSGSGDALCGIIVGLCARGADPLRASVWGVYLHACAGDGSRGGPGATDCWPATSRARSRRCWRGSRDLAREVVCLRFRARDFWN